MALGALAGANGASLTHALTTLHEACAEHGDWVHADDGAPHDDSDSEREHEHCELLLGAIPIAESSLRPMAEPLTVGPAAPVPALLDHAASVITDAPKTSPPVASLA